MASGARKSPSATLDPPRGAAPRPVGRVIEYQAYIDGQLRKTRARVKWVDFWTSTVLLGIGVLAYLLVAALIDHWIVPGGLGFWGRALLLGGLLTGIALHLVWNFLPHVLRRVNPVYAAAAIERAGPMKNTLVNFLLLRKQPEAVPEGLLEAMKEQAAVRLSTVPGDAPVDRGALIRWGYVLIAVLVAAVGYTLFAPKDALRSMGRVIAPWADLAAPTRVSIEELTPGDVDKRRDDVVEIQLRTRGVRSGDAATVFFSPSGLPEDDTAVPLVSDDLTHWSAVIPAGDGLKQDLFYYVQVGDVASPRHRVRVLATPVISVASVRYEYPAYTGLPPRTVDGQGDLKALEGTTVVLTADANQPIRAAHVAFDQARNKDVELTPDASRRKATGGFALALAKDRIKPLHSSYVLRFTNIDGQENPKPVEHRIEVVADQGPELKVVEPTTPPEQELQVPVVGFLRITLAAQDVDFKLAKLSVVFERFGAEMREEQLLAEPRDGPFSNTFTFSPQSYGLKPGDRVIFRGRAKDNRTPEPNVAESARYTIVVAGGMADPNQQPPPPQQGDQPQPPNQQQNQNQPGQGRPPERGPRNPEQQPPNGQPQQGPQDGQPQNGQQGGQRQNGQQQPGDQQQPDRNGGAQDPSNPQQQQQQPEMQGNPPPVDGQQPQNGQQQQNGQPQNGQPRDGQPGQQQQPRQPGDAGQAGQQKAGQPQDGQGQSGQGQSQQQQPGDPSQQGIGGDKSKQQPGAGGEQRQSGDQQEANRQQGGAEQTAGGERQEKPIDPNVNSGDAFEELQKHYEKKFGENQQGKQDGPQKQQDQMASAGDQRQQQRGQPADQGAGDKQPAGDQQPAADKHGRDQEPADQKSGAGQKPGQPQEGEAGSGKRGGSGGGAEGAGKAEQQQGANDGAGGKGTNQQQPSDRRNGTPGGNEQGMQRQDGAGDATEQRPGENNGGGREVERRPSEGGDPSQQGKQPAAGDKQPGDLSGAKPTDKPAAGQNPGGEKVDGPKPGGNQPQADMQRPGDPAGQQPRPGAQPNSGNPTPDQQGRQTQQGNSGATGGTAPEQDAKKPEQRPGEQGPTAAGAKPSANAQQPAGNDRAGGAKGSSANEGSPEQQEMSKPRDPNGAAGSQNQQQSSQGNEAKSPSGSRSESDSRGDSSGDRAGKGEEGGGMRSNQKGTGAAGSNSAGDQGAGAAQEQGDSATGNQAGDKVRSGQPTGGEPSGQRGAGSNSQAGGQQPGGQSGSANTGGERQGDPPRNPQDVQNGKPGGSSTGGGGQPEGDFNPQARQAPEPGGDEANLEYTKKVTDLTLDRLKNDLEKGTVDPELLKKFSSKEALEQFVRRWDEMRKAARQPGPQADAVQKQYQETLKGLGLRPRATEQQGLRSGDDDFRQVRGARRSAPPAKYADQYRAYTTGIGQGGEK